MGLFDRNRNKKKKQEPEYNEDSIITLYDDDGKGYKFEFCDLIKLEGHRYCVLLPLFYDVTEDTEDDSVIILEAIDDDPDSDEESYISVDSEETLNTVFQIFKQRFLKRYGS